MFVTLMYHLVCDDLDGPMVVSLDAFRRQLEVLGELGARFLRLADVNRILLGGDPPERGVLLTFDDGYRNAVETALPILGEHAAPAALSLCSSYLRPETRPASTVHVSQEFAGVREVETWLRNGHDIAGHTVSHPRLTELPAEEAEAEVERDKRALEETFGRAVDSFVYPFGAFNEEVRSIVGRHYRNAFSDGRGDWPSAARRLSIRRTRVRPEWTPDLFRRQMETALAQARE